MTSKNLEYAGTIDVKVLLALKKRITKKTFSPVFDYVFVNDGYVVSTDSFIMELEKTNLKDGVLLNVDFIPEDTLGEIEVYHNDERVEMRNANFVIKTKKPDHNVPSIKRIVDNFENTKEKIIFDPKDIVKEKTISFKIDGVDYGCDKRRWKELKKVIGKEVEFSELTSIIRIGNLIIRITS